MTVSLHDSTIGLLLALEQRDSASAAPVIYSLAHLSLVPLSSFPSLPLP